MHPLVEMAMHTAKGAVAAGPESIQRLAELLNEFAKEELAHIEALKRGENSPIYHSET